VEISKLKSGSRVVEIGPGLGALTAMLLNTGSEVLAIEVDRDLADFLRDRHPDLRLIEADATKLDWSEVLVGSGWQCVANLPYNVGTRLVTQMVCMPETFTRLVVMLQREVAQRMVAPAGDRKRGSLSVHMEAYSETRIAIRVPPGAFHPPPRVDSCVLDVRLRKTPILGGVSPDWFSTVVRASFCAPRKSLRNALRSRFDRDVVTAALKIAEIDGGLRASVLDLSAFGRLANALSESLVD